MEFELLDNDDLPANVFEAIRRYLQNPRRQLQSWGDRAPLLAAATMLGLVVVEWVLSDRLAGGLGRGLSALPQALGLALTILLAESVLIGAAAGIAAISGKTGLRRTAMAHMNFALAPLLLVLPVTLLCEAVELPGEIRIFIMALLCIKALSSWKEGIETSFKLNRLQGFAAFYLAAGVSVLIALLSVYAIAIGKIAGALR